MAYIPKKLCLRYEMYVNDKLQKIHKKDAVIMSCSTWEWDNWVGIEDQVDDFSS